MPPSRLACFALLVALATMTGCASIPQGQSAIDAVNVEGNVVVSSSDIEEKIATTSSPKFLELFRGFIVDYTIFDRFVLARDLARVERLYRARGFYEAHARAARVVHTSDNHVEVTIEVEEGLPINVRAIEIAGAERLPKAVVDAVRAAIDAKVQKGKRFQEEDFAAAEVAAKRALTDRSYAYARVKRFASVDLPQHAADATFGITAGPASRFGPIRIVGLGSLPEYPVRRALDLKEGEVYSTSTLDTAQQALLDLGVFGSVDIHPEIAEAKLVDEGPRKVETTTEEDQAPIVPIIVKVEPTRLHAVRLGGGFELDVIKTDVHLRAGWESLNFLGGLRHFRVDFTPGAVLYPMRFPDMHAPTNLLPEEKLRAELRQPGFIEARTHGIVRGEFNIYPVILTPNTLPGDPVMGYRETKGAVGADRQIWKLFSALTYNIQFNTPFSYLGPLDETAHSILISYVDLLQNLDFRNDKVHPHSGVYFGNDLQFAGGVLGGDAEDIRVQPEVRGYIPIAHKVTLALRGSIGLSFPLNYGDTLQTNTASGQVPPGVDKAAWARDVQIVYFRSFFAGGPSSNRGWPLRGIGPHGIAPFFTPGLAAQQVANSCDRNNPSFDEVRCSVPLGGLSLWEANAELRYGISGPLSGATFCDMADVSPHRVDIRLQRPHLSCGLGLRYDTPVGPIRLDVAYRIPGAQTLEATQIGDDGNPGTIFGVPIALAFGIGEAF